MLRKNEEKVVPFEKKKTKPIADEIWDAQMRKMRSFANVSSSNMSVPVRRQRERATARTEKISSLSEMQMIIRESWIIKTIFLYVTIIVTSHGFQMSCGINLGESRGNKHNDRNKWVKIED